MGACSSNEEVLVDRNIEKHMKRDAESQRNLHRLLLLGAGESGKSTIYKQSVDVYGKGYSTHARMQYSSIIHANVIRSMRTLILESEKRTNLSDFKETICDAKEFSISPDLQEATNAVLNARRDQNAMYVLTPELASDVECLWQDKGVRRTYEERAKFQLFDSADYFFDRVKELAMEAYVPSFEHMLRCRVQTTGIHEHEFSIDNNIFRIVDVGGQRSERKKWIRCFEGVTCVVFVAAISTYDQVLFEDSETNRLHEWFTKTSMILFLNKSDLYAKKIKKVPITVCPALRDYNGPESDANLSLKYMAAAFLDCNRTGKPVYVHVTCATNRENFERVFLAVKDTVLRENLRRAGLLVQHN